MLKIKKYRAILETILALGLVSVGRVTTYRILKKCGWIKFQTPIGKPLVGEFFSVSQKLRTLPSADNYKLTHKAFSRFDVSIPPKEGWYSNCMTGVAVENPDRHWTQIPDFGTAVGDIKTVWEASRFDWLPVAAAKAIDNDVQSHVRQVINNTLVDWSANNPVNQGPNWKCGQETSLRVINLIIAHRLLSPQSKLTPMLCLFIEQHLNRISKSLSYAIGQDNNHAVSEAVALFIGGIYLSDCPEEKNPKLSQKYYNEGRKALEASIERLVFEDGMFSQYSAVYHRMLLALVSIAEAIRKENALPPFSDVLNDRMKAATLWMLHLIDNSSGDVPNLGANDGTFLFNLDGSSYRDFRPTTEFSARVFLATSFYSESRLCKLFCPEVLHEASPIKDVAEFPNGGLLIARTNDLVSYLRLPIYKFRPSQSDGLHLDIWKDGKNIALDSGTFSYADLESVQSFSGTDAHNTISFDTKDQMPRLGRFLFAKWLCGVGDVAEADKKISGEYTDSRGCHHKRSVEVKNDELIVSDFISGYLDHATQSWHLSEDDWILLGNTVSCKTINIMFEADSEFDLELATAPRSLYYLSKDQIPVVRLTTKSSSNIKTTIKFLSGQSE